MITGAQVREARVLLKWALWRLAKAAKMSLKVAAKVESVDGVPDVTAARLLSVQTALEEAGIEFVYGDQPAVRLRQVSGA